MRLLRELRRLIDLALFCWDLSPHATGRHESRPDRKWTRKRCGF